MAAAIQKFGQKIISVGPRTVAFMQPKLTTFWNYARIEMKPPSPSEIPLVTQGLVQLYKGAVSGKWKNVTVKQATLNTLVGIEVAMWFFIGECIGKRSLVGYQIPGACHFEAEL